MKSFACIWLKLKSLISKIPIVTNITLFRFTCLVTTNSIRNFDSFEFRILKTVNYMLQESTISLKIHTAKATEHRQNLCWYVLGVEKVYSHFNLFYSHLLSVYSHLQLDGIWKSKNSGLESSTFPAGIWLFEINTTTS